MVQRRHWGRTKENVLHRKFSGSSYVGQSRPALATGLVRNKSELSVLRRGAGPGSSGGTQAGRLGLRLELLVFLGPGTPESGTGFDLTSR
ncbi:hypothetical protein LEMLEM_LOCUS12107 [Lemmus lemmus]